MLAEARVDAGAIIEAVRAALKVDSELLTGEEKDLIVEEINFLEMIEQTENTEEIHQAVDALNKATEAFAARRMDISIAQAFNGRNVDTIKL